MARAGGEMADTLALGASPFGGGGSSPLLPTNERTTARRCRRSFVCARGGNRTRMTFRSRNFKSRVYTNSTTRAAGLFVAYLRPRRESNPRMELLQSPAFPLRHVAFLERILRRQARSKKNMHVLFRRVQSWHASLTFLPPPQSFLL